MHPQNIEKKSYGKTFTYTREKSKLIFKNLDLKRMFDNLNCFNKNLLTSGLTWISPENRKICFTTLTVSENITDVEHLKIINHHSYIFACLKRYVKTYAIHKLYISAVTANLYLNNIHICMKPGQDSSC